MYRRCEREQHDRPDATHRRADGGQYACDQRAFAGELCHCHFLEPVCPSVTLNSVPEYGVKGNVMAEALAIGKLADAAEVNIETIRYYQRRGLLDEPPKPLGGHRRYAPEQAKRVRFIKRAQALAGLHAGRSGRATDAGCGVRLQRDANAGRAQAEPD